MKIRNRIYQLTGSEYGTLGSCYAIKYQDGYIMIDSGVDYSREIIQEVMKYWGIDKQKITHVFLTHGHDDHCGNASFFQGLGAKIYISKEDAPMMAQGHLGLNSPCTNHEMPKCSPDYLIENDDCFTVGDIKLNTYKMPGHTDGTVIYTSTIDDDLIIFSGDLFFPDGELGDQAKTGWKGDLTYSVEKLTASFDKLFSLKLEPSLILSGHGKPLFGSKAKDCIRVAYKYHILNNR